MMMSAVGAKALGWQKHCGVGGLHHVIKCAAISRPLNLVALSSWRLRH